MNFGATAIEFTEEQAMLQESAMRLCAELSPIETVRSLLEDPRGYSETAWQMMVDMGWTGLALPESVGGSEFGLGAFVTVFEAMGRHLLTTPLMSTVLAADLLARCDLTQSERFLREVTAGAKATVAFLEREDWGSTKITTTLVAGRLEGRKVHVADAATADLIVIPALRDGQSVLVVLHGEQLAELQRHDHDVLDATRRAQTLAFSLAVDEAQIIGSGEVGQALTDTRLVGALLVAAEATGAAVSCLNVTIDYLKTRKQFGRLIGSYQALKHPSVDILCAIDASKSLIYQAATELTSHALTRNARIACHMAKSKASETLVYAGDRAVQFHGGMGFTYDCDAQLFLKRGLWAQQAFGDPMHHRKRMAALILDATEV